MKEQKLMTIQELNEYIESGLIKPHLVGLHRYNKKTELCET